MGCFSCLGRKRVNSVPGTIAEERQEQPPASPSVETSGNQTLSTSAITQLPANIGRNVTVFTLSELQTVTDNFNSDNIIGHGGFGVVYKGTIPTTGQIVAVKRLKESASQGEREFLVEIHMLSVLSHPNLVKLVGYCSEGDHHLVVYEYMPLGSLEDHLHARRPGDTPLDWHTRVIIATDAAKGLYYLHNEANPAVIFRDLKTSNILLDEGFQAKLSDFGLAKFGPTGDKSHVTTRVMGTEGYCAPEYAATGFLTLKSDIYTFGVLMLELVTACTPADITRVHGQYRLAKWTRLLLQDKNRIHRAIDPALGGNYSRRNICHALEMALVCLDENPAYRPNMTGVLNSMYYLVSHLDPLPDPDGGGGQTSIGQSSSSSSGVAEGQDNLERLRRLNRERAIAEAKMRVRSRRERGESSRTNDGADPPTQAP